MTNTLSSGEFEYFKWLMNEKGYDILSTRDDDKVVCTFKARRDGITEDPEAIRKAATECLELVRASDMESKAQLQALRFLLEAKEL